jgi:hypothetical protein
VGVTNLLLMGGANNLLVGGAKTDGAGLAHVELARRKKNEFEACILGPSPYQTSKFEYANFAL